MILGNAVLEYAVAGNVGLSAVDAVEACGTLGNVVLA